MAVLLVTLAVKGLRMLNLNFLARKSNPVVINSPNRAMGVPTFSVPIHLLRLPGAYINSSLPM